MSAQLLAAVDAATMTTGRLVGAVAALVALAGAVSDWRDPGAENGGRASRSWPD
ncbi:hypothetical protein SAMN05421630_112121 [Prauserella marina]|uniref:Uncharacterized protein n=1 Tax=Prauserella marina TaxID=530584 RepID=A0A1G6XJ81_9PSEU|nr:hypothetical protein DES30_110117 [Prauserella marina]SDD78132.1 hypothetical protein SAMN05421630_112121 [Prauserella marina]